MRGGEEKPRNTMDFDDLKQKSNDMGVYPPNPNPTSINKNPNPTKKHPPPPPPPQPLMQPGGYPMGPYHPDPQVGYASPYQGYPSATPSFKLYSSASFNRYGQGYGGPWMPEQDMYGGDTQKFGRLMFATMVTLIIVMCMVSMVMWFLFGTEVPEFKVGSFSVSDFTINNDVLQANWEVNVSIVNPNTNLKVHSGSVHMSIVYENFPLAASLVDPFCIEGKEEYNLHFKLDNVTRQCEKVLATEISRDQQGGTMFLGLHLGLGAKITSTTIWKKESLSVSCDDLKINLASDGTGALSEDSSTECILNP